MKVVQELVAYFDQRGKLSRRQLKKLLEQNFIASDAPTNMHGLCESVGATYYFRVTGTIEGQLWGTDIYSGDSTIGAAAVPPSSGPMTNVRDGEYVPPRRRTSAPSAAAGAPGREDRLAAMR